MSKGRHSANCPPKPPRGEPVWPAYVEIVRRELCGHVSGKNIGPCPAPNGLSKRIVVRVQFPFDMPRQCSAQAAISGVGNALFSEIHSEFSLASLSLKPRERLTGISDRAQYLTRYGYSEWPDSFIEPYRGTSHLRRINADAPEKLWYDTARAAFFYKRASYEFERVGIRQGKPVRKPGSRRFSKPNAAD